MSCLLPAASCLLPAACCLLPAASCLLPPACCLLPAASCPPVLSKACPEPSRMAQRAASWHAICLLSRCNQTPQTQEAAAFLLSRAQTGLLPTRGRCNLGRSEYMYGYI
jgi:hypothetical protein